MAKARAVWRMMMRILSREGARPRVSMFFFKAIVQLVLIFGADTWMFASRMGQVLGGVPMKVGAETDGKAPTSEAGREVRLHLSGGGKIGGGV